MDQDKKFFFMKLVPPRASFALDMTDAERDIMLRHVAYWAPFVDDGTVIVLGPVMDPKGVYGMAVVRVDCAESLLQLMAADPANGLNSYEYYPMRAVIKNNVSSTIK